jgi:hypothetical protein
MYSAAMVADKIEYTGKVYIYSSGMPADHVTSAKEKLAEYGIKMDDMIVIEVPEGVPEGCIMVTVWPHYLSVAKVKRVREGSIYAPQLFNIQM